jgi:hypothetical protein
MRTSERFAIRKHRLARLLELCLAVPRIPTLEHSRERQALVTWMLDGGAHVDVERLDWDAVSDLARRFALVGPIHRHAAGSMPADLLEALASHVEILRMQNQILLHDATTIALALTAHAVPHVFLKGTALLLMHPTEFASRQTDDIDVLIHPEHLERAGEALLAHGFVPKPEPYSKGQHPLVVVSPAGTPCELHVRLEPKIERATWAVESYAVRNGVQLRVPGREAIIEHLCHHVLAQHAGVPRYLPRHLVEIAVLSSASGSVSLDTRWSRISFELVGLVRRAQRDPFVRTAMGMVLFPRWHTMSIHQFTERAKDIRFRGARREIKGLMRLPRYLLHEVA